MSIQKRQHEILLATALVGALLFAAASPVAAAADTSASEREVTDLELSSADGQRLLATLSLPRRDGPFPAVITIHGGPGGREQSVVRAWKIEEELLESILEGLVRAGLPGEAA